MTKKIIVTHTLEIPQLEELIQEDNNSERIKVLLHNGSFIDEANDLIEASNRFNQEVYDEYGIFNDYFFSGWLVSPSGYSMKDITEGHVYDDFGSPLCSICEDLTSAIKESEISFQDCECLIIQHVNCFIIDEDVHLDESFRMDLDSNDIRMFQSTHKLMFKNTEIFSINQDEYEHIADPYDFDDFDYGNFSMSDYYKSRLGLLEY